MAFPTKAPSELSQKRSAFTLVELLVVIAIIGLLAAITAGASVQIIAYQRVSNAETMVRMLDDALRQQWKLVVEAAKREQPPATVQGWAFAANSVNNDKRAQVIWAKLRLKQIFPMNFSEAQNPGRLPPQYGSSPLLTDLPGNPTYVQVLTNAGVTGSAVATQWPFESSAMLLLALSQGYGGAKFSPELLPSGAIAETPGGLPQVVDPWQVPIVLYRWPTVQSEAVTVSAISGNTVTLAIVQNIYANPANLQSAPGAPAVNTTCTTAFPGMGVQVTVANPTNITSGSELILFKLADAVDSNPNKNAKFPDPLDPEGTLVDPTWNSWSNYQSHGGVWWFEQYCHPVHIGSDQATYTPQPLFVAPVICSAGRNNNLGLAQQLTLVPPISAGSANPYQSPLLPDLMIPDGTGNDFDNVYSFRLRQGARGE
jgi:prepilin-type N-terminal cleavage/methylation domain-containing protein